MLALCKQIIKYNTVTAITEEYSKHGNRRKILRKKYIF
jgi:hypothetical protein